MQLFVLRPTFDFTLLESHETAVEKITAAYQRSSDKHLLRVFGEYGEIHLPLASIGSGRHTSHFRSTNVTGKLWCTVVSHRDLRFGPSFGWAIWHLRWRHFSDSRLPMPSI